MSPDIDPENEWQLGSAVRGRVAAFPACKSEKKTTRPPRASQKRLVKKPESAIKEKEKSELDMEIAELENSFKEGRITAEEFVAKKKSLLKE